MKRLMGTEGMQMEDADYIGALRLQVATLEAEVERLTELLRGTGANRYWEGRWRDEEAEVEQLRAAAWDARLALDLALLADGLGSDIKNRLRTAWLKIGDALKDTTP